MNLTGPQKYARYADYIRDAESDDERRERERKFRRYLSHYIGTENYWRFDPGHAFMMTDGVRSLLRQARAEWAAYAFQQSVSALVNDALENREWFYVLTLSREENGARLTITDDDDRIVVQTRLPNTKFALAEFDTWVSIKGNPDKPHIVWYLPSEH